MYNNYHQEIPQINLYYRIKNLKIWKESIGVIDTIFVRSNAFLNLPSLRKGEKYDSTFYDIRQFSIAGETIIYNRFVPLLEGTDYTYNSYTGVVCFFKEVKRIDAFAATYAYEGATALPDDDIYFGDSESEVSAILKLIKPLNLQPAFRQAWKL